MLSEREHCCMPFGWRIRSSDQTELDRHQLDVADRDAINPGSPSYASGLVGFRTRPVPDQNPLLSENLVRVVHGVRDDTIPVAGQAVGEVRSAYRWIFNFRPDAHAFVEGERVADDYVLAPQDNLEFLYPYGFKGVGRVWTKEEFCEFFKLSNEQFQEWKRRGLPFHSFSDGDERIIETDFDMWSMSDLESVSPDPPSNQTARKRTVADQRPSAQGSGSLLRFPDQPKWMTDEIESFIRALLAVPERYGAIIESLSQIDVQQTKIGAQLNEIHEFVLTQRPIKEWYTVAEMSDILGKKPYTVREWLRQGRVKGDKMACGRGTAKDWIISHEELKRYQNEGLLPPR